MARQYDGLISKYGPSQHALHADGARYEKIHQKIKFQYVLNQLSQSDSLLDVGCGLGHLRDFCAGRGWKGTYTGVDISAGMVEATKKRLRMEDVHQVDILEQVYDQRHDVVASIATL